MTSRLGNQPSFRRDDRGFFPATSLGFSRLYKQEPDYQSVQHHPPVRAIDPHRRQREGGYLLLAILLMMALMIIAATIEAPRLVQQMKRDREEEMIHRGTEYARAIKKFYKKFGRYPTSLEQLDNTNQIRFLRRRYKDPLTKDGKWTLLHYGDIQMLANPSAPGTAAASPGGAPFVNQALANPNAPGTPAASLGSTPGGAPFVNGSGSEGSGGTFAGSPAQPPQYTNGPGSGGSGGTFGGIPPQRQQDVNSPGSDGSGGGSTSGTGGSGQPGNNPGGSPFGNSGSGQTCARGPVSLKG